MQLQAALQNLYAAALRESHLEAEVQRARREFFGPRIHGKLAPVAEQRFLEWFLLERESERLGAPPREALLPSCDAAELLEDSFASVFTVASSGNGVADVRDLQDEDSFELSVPEGALQKGDLVVGRLHPDPSGGWQPSAALAVYRPGAALASAFQRDLKNLDLDRRLTQIELEHLLLARTPGATEIARPPIEHIEAQLETVLRRGGCGRSAAEISEDLALAARPGAVVGPLLDELAFDKKRSAGARCKLSA